ncbi:MAG: glycoside hydrolase family 78 protein [Opitutales bacterium]|nr:glycoside hydrolase family 78 protein [Opitutales bacterium]
MALPPPFSDAQWIQSPFVGGPCTSAPAPYLRIRFDVPGEVAEATLHITALGLFEAEINGQAVSEEVFSPGWTDYGQRVRYLSYPVAQLLRPGPNILGALLGDGWYCGRVATLNRQFYGDQPRLLGVLEGKTTEGQTFRVVSNGEWETTASPVLANDMLAGEAYDARREVPHWSEPTDSPATWFPVAIHPGPDIALVPHEDPPVRRQEVLEGKLLTAPKPKARSLRFDLGQNIAGRVRVTVRGEKGATIKLRHAEVLDKKGGLYTANLRGAEATDVYTLKGEGEETWEPRFTFHGFRYAEVYWTKPHTPGEVMKVEGVVLHNELPRTGAFACSHPLLNQLFANTVWGMKDNFLEAPTDCPQRDERLGWTGDAQVFVRTASFIAEVSAFFHKWIQDMQEAQSPNGAIPPVIPDVPSFGLPEDGGPAWADAVCIVPWELYRAYGDKTFLEKAYPLMERYMTYLAEKKVKDGVRGHPELDPWVGFGDWLSLDGSGRLEGGTPKDLIGTAFYANNAAILRDTAKILGKENESAHWADLEKSTRQKFRERYVTPQGYLVGGSQTACVLALHFSLLTPEQQPGAIAQLVSLIHGNGNKIGTGFVGTPYILPVLEKAGHLNLAYTLLEQEDFPSWLFPVKNGATTIWERWDGWSPEKGFQDPGMNSFNHYAYGSVCSWMVETVAGLVPDEPGYCRIRFKPRPGGTLQNASATLQTARGEAAIAWSLSGERLTLDLTVPAGCEGLPDPGQDWLTTDKEGPLSPGQHTLIWTRRRQD